MTQVTSILAANHMLLLKLENNNAVVGCMFPDVFRCFHIPDLSVKIVFTGSRESLKQERTADSEPSLVMF